MRAAKYLTLNDEQLNVPPILLMPQDELSRAGNVEVSLSQVGTYFSHSSTLLQQEKRKSLV